MNLLAGNDQRCVSLNDIKVAFQSEVFQRYESDLKLQPKIKVFK